MYVDSYTGNQNTALAPKATFLATRKITQIDIRHMVQLHIQLHMKHNKKKLNKG